MAARQRYPLTPPPRLNNRGLLDFARASAERDAAAAFPDSETGKTALPFERILAGHVAARLEAVGRGYAHDHARAADRVAAARARVTARTDVCADAAARATEASDEHRAAVDALLAAERPRRRFAHLSWSPLTRAGVLGVITTAEAVALKPTLDGLGAPYLQTCLLAAAIVFAGLVLAGHLARHTREQRASVDERRAGRPVRAAGGTFLSPAVIVALVVLVVTNVFLASVRASTFVGEIALLGPAGAPLRTGFPVAFGLFLSLQALFTMAAAAVEYHAHDPVAAAVRRTGLRLRWARFRLRRARRALHDVTAAQRAAVQEAIATVEAYRGLAREERARVEIVRDSYRADLVARCPIERAAALAALERADWPLPAWADGLDREIARLTARIPADVRPLEEQPAGRDEPKPAKPRAAEPVPSQPSHHSPYSLYSPPLAPDGAAVPAGTYGGGSGPSTNGVGSPGPESRQQGNRQQGKGKPS
ncbi:hypothetical protein [Frankia sp. CiP1_Cm_nod2]|uniref:hypothetical protein n=1 Tax=Frankia sp. CiP1_Cm_nod2 TaxID=2897161 RepID=UPI00202472AA